MPRRNNGARLRYLEKRNCYYIVWSEGGRSRERSTGTQDSAEAQIALAEFIRSREKHTGPRDPSEILVTDILADYAAEQGPTTRAPWRIAAAVRPLVEFWQGRTCIEVTRETCRRYEKERNKSSGTIRRELGVLRAAINHGYKEGRITRTIAVQLPRSAPPRERWLQRGEVAKLLIAALKERRVRLHLPLFILLGVYTGHRKEALLSLRWHQVDFARGFINFNLPTEIRTNKRKAHIPIPRKLLTHLRRARLRGSELGFVIHENGNRVKDIKRGFATACRRAGLQGVTPHTLRHTCATWLMIGGVPAWDAASFLGMSPETLQRVYGHHHPDYLSSATRALS